MSESQSESRYAAMQKLGLSKTAVDCYECLVKEGSANVAQLSERLSRPRTGLYRVLKELEEQGFVTSLKTNLQPIYFQAENLNKALDNFARYQRKVVAELLKD